MESYFPFHNISEFENMIMNILNEGQEVVWQLIESEKDAINRCKQRKMYAQAINKIEKGK
jgi:hypothetical protein